jgi:hypothetical protein
LVGKGRALQIILSDEVIGAQEAYRIGSEGESGSARIAVTPRGNIEPSSDKPKLWLQVSLFLLTILTTTWAGASQVGVDLMSEPSQFMVGLPFSVGLLAILSAHELGHFSRRDGTE